MNIQLVLLLALGIGIVVGIKSKKLTVTELLVCGSFGLLLGGTALGAGINDVLVRGTETVVPVIAAWFR